MAQHTYLQIEFEFACTLGEYRDLAEHAAPNIARVPGLVSKLWIVDEERRRAGDPRQAGHDPGMGQRLLRRTRSLVARRRDPRRS